MANIKIAGNIAVIESAIPFDTIKRIEKYRPNALQLFDQDKKPYFAVGTSDGRGSVSRYGVSFCRASYGGGQKAVVNIEIPDGTDDVTKWVEDMLGVAILNLNEIEANIGATIEKVDGDIATICQHIIFV